jgi:hypothetical protein
MVYLLHRIIEIILDNPTEVKRQKHLRVKEKTRNVTYRLPVHIVEELETEAMNRNISQNVLAKQVLGKFISWDRFADKIGMIPVPRKILEDLGSKMEAKDINTIINTIKPIITNNVMFIKGKYDLKRCIETLEDYMRASGMNSDHRVEGSLHHFVIQHELGFKWSLFTAQLLKEIFHEFLPEQNVKAQTTESTVIVTIALGTDFREHDY